ncbi:2-dehydro-3-deoxygalactonokinase [Delftia sp. PS-11]|uniref:2-dehydro-3-deoxygalactonokinase n=1 Tax=Delftia sp. PS-11 TaxID=2767222 RepID=UPI0024542F7D|nr:2-dehydro-3-deoxygalactonokinase [Delftia sp. PS-11]KAJ8745348.1 2-dehydro-3-deoxygalactonokinase [Delftia sp. PS-11]
MNILTVDTGTTNTRATVWHGSRVLGQAARQVGVRDTAISGNRATLQAGVRDTIEAALARCGMQACDIGLALASGMITSNVGLHELPHLVAPAGRSELACAMAAVRLPEVFGQPIWFVPGVCNPVRNIGLHNCESMDMMRGEETETMGLLARVHVATPAVIVLPGSHSKFVHLDAQGRISGCVTTLAGEMLQVLTHNTILADSLHSDFASDIDAEMLLAGARSARQIGLGRACFVVRALDLFTIYDRNARANFLLGAVLGADLLTLKNSSAIHVNPGTAFYITGKPLLREALSLLVRDDDFFSGPVVTLTDAQQSHLASLGAQALAAERGLLGPCGAVW